MAERKELIRQNAIGDLYRAANFLARGERELGLKFAKNASKNLDLKIPIDLPDKILAEKLLDRFKQF